MALVNTEEIESNLSETMLFQAFGLAIETVIFKKYSYFDLSYISDSVVETTMHWLGL